ncbi:glutamyl-tRNA reductase [Halosimplex halophilum]|uniref:glutamyl-tRNA reductase n=1 Tax=Halosimplex halophilum TaxID=2559572 RepID=UPI00107F26EB|nr:glutamyl-tRNA reductase [Halosimplex halophilum]
MTGASSTGGVESADSDAAGTAERPDDPDTGTTEPDAETPDPDAARARIRERAGEVRDREVETALTKLDARSELSERDREAVERLADRLVARLLAAPERGLRAAAERDDHDPETVATALSLFGE